MSKYAGVIKLVVVVSAVLGVVRMQAGFQEDAINSVGQVIVKVIGTTILAAMQETRDLYHWGYNTLFPHVEEIENRARRIKELINEIDKKMELMSERIKEDARRLVDKILQLPDKEDVQSALDEVLAEIIDQQKQVTVAFERTISQQEARLKEIFTEYEEAVTDELTLCRKKVEQVHDEIQDRHVDAHQKVSAIVHDNQQIFEILSPADTTIKQVLEHAHK